MIDDRIATNRALQRELYGQSLGDLLGALMTTLHLTQAETARTLGLSAPMLSQLMSAQRVKIGNPLVVQRLQNLTDLAGRGAAALEDAEVRAALAEIKASSQTLSRPRSHPPQPEAVGDPADAVRLLLSAVASGRDLAAAADLLRPRYPALADVLQTYGNGPQAEARRHYSEVTAGVVR